MVRCNIGPPSPRNTQTLAQAHAHTRAQTHTHTQFVCADSTVVFAGERDFPMCLSFPPPVSAPRVSPGGIESPKYLRNSSWENT